MIDTYSFSCTRITLIAAFHRVPFVPCKPTEEYPLSSKIVATFLELGDATSRNLEFSHRRDVLVSYGEETITENNLLEIRRRHPDRVHVETFSRAEEARRGADWEWHIVGQQLTLKMRVQAKRVQCNNKLKINYKVRSSGRQQRALLLEGAVADNMKPLYCIYCSEPQRSLWTQSHPMDDFEGYQTGCLLADANDVSETTTKLCRIERRCIPWHYLFERADFARKYQFERENWASRLYELSEVMPDRAVSLVSDTVSLYVDDLDAVTKGQSTDEGWNAPTIADLNGERGGDFDRIGVAETNEEDHRERLSSVMRGGTYLDQEDQAKIQARGIYRMLVIDVRPER